MSELIRGVGRYYRQRKRTSVGSPGCQPEKGVFEELKEVYHNKNK